MLFSWCRSKAISVCLWCNTNTSSGVWSWKPSKDWAPLGSDLCYARGMPNGSSKKLKTHSTSNKCWKTILSFIWGEKLNSICWNTARCLWYCTDIKCTVSMYVLYDYDEVIKTLYAGRTLASLTKSNAIKEQCSERFLLIILSSELPLNIELSDK